MPQGPFQVDQLQIEPGSGQNLRITRDSLSGSMRFQDAILTTGINLQDMAGLSAIDGVRVVGRAGSGAKYLTIQSALDSIPSTSSANTPYTIFCFPGIYLENLVISKDGIAIVGLGQASIVGVSNLPTVSITSGVLTTPQSVLLQNLKVQTSFAGKECVLVQGGPGLNVGLGGVVLRNCNLAALGVGSYTVRSDTANFVRLFDCTSDESAPTAILAANQTAGFLVSGGTHPASQVDYNSGGAIPATVGSSYEFNGCRSVGNVLSTLQNIGTLKVTGCLSVGNLTLNGNRPGTVTSSVVGNLSVGGTAALTLSSSKRGTSVGTGTLDESMVTGSVNFTASLSEAVTFPVPRSNANYQVLLDTGVLASASVAPRTVNGFTINFGLAQTTTVNWTLVAL